MINIKLKKKGKKSRGIDYYNSIDSVNTSGTLLLFCHPETSNPVARWSETLERNYEILIVAKINENGSILILSSNDRLKMIVLPNQDTVKCEFRLLESCRHLKKLWQRYKSFFATISIECCFIKKQNNKHFATHSSIDSNERRAFISPSRNFQSGRKLL